MRRKVSLWLPVIVWSGIIFYMSSIPGLKVTSDTFWDVVLRKLAHLTEYLVLYVLVYRATRRVWWSAGWCVVYALSDEMHQKWVSTRDGNLRDVVIDVSGTLLGWALVRRRK